MCVFRIYDIVLFRAKSQLDLHVVGKEVETTDCFQKFGGKQGEHSEPFGLMLAEMQSLYRAHPGAVW